MSVIAFRPVAVVNAKLKGSEAWIPGVRFAPTASTAERLAKQRMVFRASPGGFRLAASNRLAEPVGPMISLPPELALVFAITFTSPPIVGDAERKAGPHIFLSNRSTNGKPQSGPQLSREETVGLKDRGWIVPRRHRASFRLDSGDRPNRIELRSYFGGTADPLPIVTSSASEATDVLVSLEDADGVAFILRPKPQGTERVIIADDELAGMKADGALELVLKAFPGPDPVSGREFTATFEK